MDPNFLEISAGRTIAYVRTAGRQPGVVFLGGFSSDMDGTKALFLEKCAIESGRAFLRFDYTGHGRSSGSFDDGSISEWADDAAEVLHRVSEEPQILVGSSMGGWIALLLARRFPDRVAGLVGIAAAPDFTSDLEGEIAGRGELDELMRDGRVSIPSDYSDEPTVITRKLIEDGPANFVMDQPLELNCPVRLLHGTDDSEVDPGLAVKLLGHADGSDMRLTMVKGADHRFSSPACLNLIQQSIDSILLEQD